MARKGLLIDYQYCTECQNCASLKAGARISRSQLGIKVDDKVFIDPAKPS